MTFKTCDDAMRCADADAERSSCDAGGECSRGCRFHGRGGPVPGLNLSFGIDNARCSNSQSRLLLLEHDSTPDPYHRAPLKAETRHHELK